jgi:RNA polymerase sigma-70 factor (ECF subfamily)
MRIFSIKYTELKDEELIVLLSKGNRMAFDEIYARYANALGRYFVRMLWKDKEKAEDFVHDLFAKLIQNPSLFDTSRNFKTWVYSVANNMCKNEYKKQEVRKNTQNVAEIPYHLEDQNRSVFNEVQDVIFKEAFDVAIDKLDAKHKEVFELRHFDGLSIKEIATVLDANEGTIKSRLFYATKQLAESLKEFHPLTT